MKKKLALLLTTTMLLMGCTSNKPKETVLMLDYLPNTNHTGIYVALEKGYYKDAGIDIKIIEPGDDNTSANLVASGQASYGVSYQEDVTYAKAAKEPLPIKAIAALIQHNTSGFVSLKDSQIESPKDFEGKVYAGWQSPSEEAVLKAVMTSVDKDPSKLKQVGSSGSGFVQLGKGVDVMWFFEAWDLMQATRAGLELNYMPLKDLDKRLDYYTPVIIANEDVLKNEPEQTKKFLEATQKGYEYAISNPEEAAEILHKYAPQYDLEFLKESQAYLADKYIDDAASWGIMKEDVWTNYTNFMLENQLIEKDVEASTQYTNEFLGK